MKRGDLLADIVTSHERERAFARGRPAIFWLRETGRATGIMAVILLITDAFSWDVAFPGLPAKRLMLVATIAAAIALVRLVRLRSDFLSRPQST